jgi:hypothetical protein
MSTVKLLDRKIVLVCIYRSPGSNFYTFLKKFRNSNSENAIKKEKSNCMWKLEHKVYGRQCKIKRIKKLLLLYNWSIK